MLTEGPEGHCLPAGEPPTHVLGSMKDEMLVRRPSATRTRQGLGAESARKRQIWEKTWGPHPEGFTDKSLDFTWNWGESLKDSEQDRDNMASHNLCCYPWSVTIITRVTVQYGSQSMSPTAQNPAVDLPATSPMWPTSLSSLNSCLPLSPASILLLVPWPMFSLSLPSHFPMGHFSGYCVCRNALPSDMHGTRHLPCFEWIPTSL